MSSGGKIVKVTKELPKVTGRMFLWRCGRPAQGRAGGLPSSRPGQHQKQSLALLRFRAARFKITEASESK